MVAGEGQRDSGCDFTSAIGGFSTWNPGPVRSRRHRVDLLPPHPRQLEALVRPRRDLLLSQHQADLPRLLPSTVEHHLPGPHPVPPHLPPLHHLHLRANMCWMCPNYLYNDGSDGDFRREKYQDDTKKHVCYLFNI